MKLEKLEILKKHCYTPLVYQRINKKLGVNFSVKEIEHFIKKIIKETNKNNFEKIGKNFYVSNTKFNIKITVNSNTFRIITVDKLVK
ncbi:DUF3781 domain-containing protein [uncultured Polaribacter sp.]|uniref:DUF3781 domain-containing protein n=1 Tax=uncultured Polaribacter sp. TaxID=174711 RepID=UPI00261DD96F|nr:DUF3781 domain-containing protein [uncultured Polaribacter sp.]